MFYTKYASFLFYAAMPSLSLSSYYNVSPASFHGQYFCAVVAAKRFMPLSSVVHALISLSAPRASKEMASIGLDPEDIVYLNMACIFTQVKQGIGLVITK